MVSRLEEITKALNVHRKDRGPRTEHRGMPIFRDSANVVEPARRENQPTNTDMHKIFMKTPGKALSKKF